MLCARLLSSRPRKSFLLAKAKAAKSYSRERQAHSTPKISRPFARETNSGKARKPITNKLNAFAAFQKRSFSTQQHFDFATVIQIQRFACEQER